MSNYCKDCKNCIASFQNYSDATSLKDDTRFVCAKRHLSTNPFTTDYNAGCVEINGFEERENKDLTEVEMLAYSIMLSDNGKAEKVANYKRYVALGLKKNVEEA